MITGAVHQSGLPRSSDAGPAHCCVIAACAAGGKRGLVTRIIKFFFILLYAQAGCTHVLPEATMRSLLVSIALHTHGQEAQQDRCLQQQCNFLCTDHVLPITQHRGLLAAAAARSGWRFPVSSIGASRNWSGGFQNPLEACALLYIEIRDGLLSTKKHSLQRTPCQ